MQAIKIYCNSSCRHIEGIPHLKKWHSRYYCCIVPRFANPELSDWVSHQRKHRKHLSEDLASELTKLSFEWHVDPMTAKWYSNFHSAREYYELHGSPPPPNLDYNASNPRWVEAGRWLIRQQELYRKQKLPLVRVRLLKSEVGVTLDRECSPPRRKRHQWLKSQDEAFLNRQ